MGLSPPALEGIEAQVLGARTVEQRRVLFALGRAAARDALAEIGLAAVAIGRGEGGEPLWPAGVVGAISHSQTVATAIVGHATDYAGLGVDVEDTERAPTPRTARLIAVPEEMDWLDAPDGAERLLMLFSAKEAIFKALYPIERVWLGFSDARLTWRAERSAFSARVLKRVSARHPAGFELDVHCTLGTTWVLSTAFVAAQAAGRSGFDQDVTEKSSVDVAAAEHRD